MRKILFNDRYGLTESVLNGTKTMTRRAVGNHMTEHDIKAYLKGYTELADKLAPYKIGEVVAVAQPYKALDYGFHGFATNPSRSCGISKGYAEKQRGWDNKMFVSSKFMPHQIRITDIKVERLQDIGEEDCLKEGIEFSDIEKNWFFTNVNNTEYHAPTCRAAFASLIDKVSGKGTWEHNPYVFAYSFGLVKYIN